MTKNTPQSQTALDIQYIFNLGRGQGQADVLDRMEHELARLDEVHKADNRLIQVITEVQAVALYPLPLEFKRDELRRLAPALAAVGVRAVNAWDNPEMKQQLKVFISDLQDGIAALLENHDRGEQLTAAIQKHERYQELIARVQHLPKRHRQGWNESRLWLARRCYELRPECRGLTFKEIASRALADLPSSGLTEQGQVEVRTFVEMATNKTLSNLVRSWRDKYRQTFTETSLGERDYLDL